MLVLASVKTPRFKHFQLVQDPVHGIREMHGIHFPIILIRSPTPIYLSPNPSSHDLQWCYVPAYDHLSGRAEALPLGLLPGAQVLGRTGAPRSDLVHNQPHPRSALTRDAQSFTCDAIRFWIRSSPKGSLHVGIQLRKWKAASRTTLLRQAHQFLPTIN